MSSKKIPREYDLSKMSDRLRFAFDKIPGTRDDQAKAVGLSFGTKVSALLGGKKTSRTTLVAIEYRSGVRAEWIESGLGSPFTHKVESEPAWSPAQGDCSVTVVSNEEMGDIHNLLSILRSKDEGTIQLIKLGIGSLVRLIGYIQRFENVISLDRREGDLGFEARRPPQNRKTDTA